MGYTSTADYMISMSEICLEENIFPHSNLGIANQSELIRFKNSNPSMGLMLESISERLMDPGMAHYRCPDKYPKARIKTISLAGELNIPWTSGILIGIGENWDERIDSILELNRINNLYGHIQEIIIQNFNPKPGIKMEGHPAPTDLDMIKTVSLSRLIICFVFSYLIISLLILIQFAPKNKISKSYMGPILNFIKRYGKFAFLILILISLYRIADIVMGVMANIFYLEKGYKISDIATYSKFFGVFATIFGGFIGGYCSYKFGTMKCLFFGALIAALSNLLFAWLAVSPISINFLIAVITADNISSGFAGAAFVIYLSGLTSIKFTATQYALFSSVMLFLPKLIAGYAGSWVDIMGYPYFFSLTALLGLPVLILIIWISKVAPVKN